MQAFRNPSPVSRRRGVALLLSIGILSTVMILVMALSTTISMSARALQHREQVQRARDLAYLSTRMALKELKSDEDFTSQSIQFETPDGASVFGTLRLYDPQIHSNAYGADRLSPLPDDHFFVFSCVVPGPREFLLVRQTWLINGSSNNERCVMIAKQMDNVSAN